MSQNFIRDLHLSFVSPMPTRKFDESVIFWGNKTKNCIQQGASFALSSIDTFATFDDLQLGHFHIFDNFDNFDIALEYQNTLKNLTNKNSFGNVDNVDNVY